MTTPESSIRLAVVAPIRSIRIGLAAMLSEDADIQIVREAVDLQELAEDRTAIDVVLIAGLPLVRLDIDRLIGSFPAPPVLVLLIDEPLPAALPAWFRLHPWSIIAADSGPADLALAIRAAANGFWLADPVLAANLFPLAADSPLTGRNTLVEPLTAREIEVLQYLSHGLANKQIAASLHISENTIKFHISAIYTKLGAGNRAEAVRLGARLGYITI